MPQATEDDLNWARSGKKPIIAVRWTDSRARIVRTKKRGHELLRVWKLWKERQGWEVRGAIGNGYVATSPEGLREAAAMRSYCPETLAQLDLCVPIPPASDTSPPDFQTPLLVEQPAAQKCSVIPTMSRSGDAADAVDLRGRFLVIHCSPLPYT